MTETLSNVIDDILEKLHEESGFETYWNRTEILSWWNDLYIETGRRGKFFGRVTTFISEADVDYYSLEEGTIEVYKVLYDNEPLYPTTMEELDENDRRWRERDSSTPTHWYIRKDERYSKIRLFPTPPDNEITINVYNYYIPEALRDNENDYPQMPFQKNKVLNYGVLAQALWQAGPGRDLERGNYYWSMFEGALNQMYDETRDRVDRRHVLRSIHESNDAVGPRLPSNYPPYPRRR